MARQRNRAVLFTEAEAEASETSDGKPTVTVRSTLAFEGFSQTESTHLTLGAALDLYRDLKEVLSL